MRSIIIFWNALPALNCMFLVIAISRQLSFLAVFLHPFRIGCFCTRHIQFIPLSFRVVWVLFDLPSFFWTWTNVHEVPRLELSQASSIFFRVLQKWRIASFRSLWGDLNFVHATEASGNKPSLQPSISHKTELPVVFSLIDVLYRHQQSLFICFLPFCYGSCQSIYWN